MFTAEEVLAIGLLAAGFTELVKFGKIVPDSYGLLVCAIISAICVSAYATSQPELALNRFLVWPLLTAFASVLFNAAGVYGFIRAVRSADVTDAKKTLVVMLIAGASVPMLSACGKRYAPGTPTQNKLAYELEQGLGIVLDTQTRLIAAVDSGVTTKAIADRFLVPARDIADLAKNRIIPSLKAYDAAVTAGDLNAQKLLTAELTPLVRQFNQLSQTAFGASLPDNVVGSLGKLLQQLQQTIRTVLQEFTPDQVPAAA